MANTMTLINAQTVSSAVASVTFTSIPNTYTDLRVFVSARCNIAGSGQTQVLTFNGSSSNLSDRYLFGTGTSVTSAPDASIIQINDANGSSTTANTFSSNQIYIANYTGSTYKSVSVEGIMENKATAGQQMLTAGLWSNTSAITSLTIGLTGGNTYVSGSTFYLYGIKNS